ncbi:MAG: hypothetical protein QNJ44_16275 [Rhodobacter sp.]|nr:hypothetical protein [Rhodobacter sp.]
MKRSVENARYVVLHPGEFAAQPDLFHIAWHTLMHARGLEFHPDRLAQPHHVMVSRHSFSDLPHCCGKRE